MWANFKIHTSTGFCSTSNLAPLPCFLQDLGMESTSLDDVLYRYASFRNLVDPITHDLIISLARYIHCPKPVGTTVSSLLYNRAGLVKHTSGSVDLPSEFQRKKPGHCCACVSLDRENLLGNGGLIAEYWAFQLIK